MPVFKHLSQFMLYRPSCQGFHQRPAGQSQFDGVRRLGSSILFLEKMLMCPGYEQAPIDRFISPRLGPFRRLHLSGPLFMHRGQLPPLKAAALRDLARENTTADGRYKATLLIEVGPMCPELGDQVVVC